MAKLIDGPAAGMFVPPNMVQYDGEIHLMLYWPKDSTSTRQAIYRLTDNENNEARFLFWSEDRPVNQLLCDALANASDDELVDLMQKMSGH